jgi:hypothetical protein
MMPVGSRGGGRPAGAPARRSGLKEVSTDRVVVEYADETGALKTATLPVAAGK